MPSETTHIEQIGNKKRIIEISLGDGSLVFPMKLLSFGKVRIFDGKNQTCTIANKTITFGINSSGNIQSLFNKF